MAAPASRSAVALPDLAHRVTQVCYKTLHALLDSLSSAPSAERSEKVFLYVLRTRHLLLRLLVAVRWTMDYGAFSLSASRALAIADARLGSLHMPHVNWYNAFMLNVRPASSVEIDVASAGTLLSYGSSLHLPRIISESVIPFGTDIVKDDKSMIEGSTALLTDRSDSLHAEIPEYVQRLGRATRRLVRLGIEKLPNVRVLRWEDGPYGAFTTVGVPDAWTVTLVATSLNLTEAAFRAYAVKVFIAPSSAYASGSILTGDQERALANAVDERMLLAWESVMKEQSDEKVKRCAECMIEAMVELVNGEVAAPLTMEILKKQARALGKTRRAGMRPRSISTKTSVVNGKEIFQSYLAMDVWQGAREFCVEMLGDYSSGKVLEISHVPELRPPDRDGLTFNSISLETYLTKIALLRSRQVLSDLREKFRRQESDLRDEQEDVSQDQFECFLKADNVLPPRLIFLFERRRKAGSSEGLTEGLDVGVNMQNGDIKYRLFGDTISSPIPASFMPAHASDKYKTIQEGNLDVVKRIRKILQWARKVASVEHRSRTFLALDVGFMRGTAPGQYSDGNVSTHAKDCYIPLENRSAKRFLLVSSDETESDSKDSETFSEPPRKKMKMQSQTKAADSRALLARDDGALEDIRCKEYGDGTAYFYFARRPVALYGDLPSVFVSAREMAVALALRDFVVISIRRNALLKEFSKAKLILPKAQTEVSSTNKLTRDQVIADKIENEDFFAKKLSFQARPLPVEFAEISFGNHLDWRVELILGKRGPWGTISEGGIWDRNSMLGSVTQDGRMIRFSYPEVSARSLRRFYFDLDKIRHVYVLLRGVFAFRNRAHFGLTNCCLTGLRAELRFPDGVSTFLSEVRLTAWCSGKYVLLDCTPSLGVQRGYLEEVISAAGQKCGKVLVALMYTAIPMGVTIERFRRKVGGNVKYVTCLRALLVWKRRGGPKGIVGIELDARDDKAGESGRSLKVSDLGRAGKVSLDMIDVWGKVIDEFSGRKIGVGPIVQQQSQCCAEVRVEKLLSFMEALDQRPEATLPLNSAMF